MNEYKMILHVRCKWLIELVFGIGIKSKRTKWDESDRTKIERNENIDIIHLQTNGICTFEKHPKKIFIRCCFLQYYGIKKDGNKKKRVIWRKTTYGKAKYIIILGQDGFCSCMVILCSLWDLWNILARKEAIFVALFVRCFAQVFPLYYSVWN